MTRKKKLSGTNSHTHNTDMIDTSPLTVRNDLKSALIKAWSEVAQTGAWLSGEQRLAIANEARNAWHCNLCKRRREALSPYTVKGDHEHLGALPGAWTEAVHRIVTDSGRITESWYAATIAAGITEDEFIELLSLVTIVTGADTFMRAIGLATFDVTRNRRTRHTATQAAGRRKGRAGMGANGCSGRCRPRTR